MTDKERLLLNKLKALADKGVGGEKINAEKKLKQLLDKLNISIEELDLDAKKWFTFNLKRSKYISFKLEQQFIVQVLSSILEPEEYEDTPLYVYHDTVEMFLKPSIATELQAKYEFYNRAFREDFDVFYTSFIYANELCSKKVKYVEELSEEELEKVYKAEAMKGNFEHKYFKQIEHKR